MSNFFTRVARAADVVHDYSGIDGNLQVVPAAFDKLRRLKSVSEWSSLSNRNVEYCTELEIFADPQYSTIETKKVPIKRIINRHFSSADAAGLSRC